MYLETSVSIIVYLSLCYHPTGDQVRGRAGAGWTGSRGGASPDSERCRARGGHPGHLQIRQHVSLQNTGGSFTPIQVSYLVTMVSVSTVLGCGHFLNFSNFKNFIRCQKFQSEQLFLKKILETQLKVMSFSLSTCVIIP